MSFLDEIMEEREYFAEIEEYKTELNTLEERLNELKDRAEQLNENDKAHMDFGNRSMGETFDEALKRMKTAKWAFGLTNKLKSPEDRKKHRRNILIVMNQLRALINRLTKQLTQEVPSEPQGRQGQSGEGRYGNRERSSGRMPDRTAGMGQQQPSMAT